MFTGLEKIRETQIEPTVSNCCVALLCHSPKMALLNPGGCCDAKWICNIMYIISILKLNGCHTNLKGTTFHSDPLSQYKILDQSHLQRSQTAQVFPRPGGPLWSDKGLMQPLPAMSMPEMLVLR